MLTRPAAEPADMPAALRPAGLHLPDAADVRWTSLTKVLLEPEANWPVQLLRRPIVAGEVGARHVALVADPEAARHILTAPTDRFVRWRIYNHLLAANTGRRNIIASDEAASRRQREIFAPMFRSELMPELSPLFRQIAARRVAHWRAEGKAVTVDAALETTRVTLEVVWRAIFGRLGDDPPPPDVDAAARRSYGAHLRRQAGEAGACLAELAGEPDGSRPPFAVMDQLAGTASQQRLSAQEIHDNARLFLNVGHETTALAMGWTLWLVGQDRTVQRRLHEEIDTLAGRGPILSAEIGRLRFLARVINESLRLLPPVAILARQAVGQETLCGETLPAGTIWAVCIYAMHRHEHLWNEPDAFLPDRFGPGSDEPRHRSAFLPFGTGTHGCLGSAFGWSEAMTVLATILQAFEVETDLSVQPRPRVAPTLRPDRELPVILRPRDRPAGS